MAGLSLKRSRAQSMPLANLNTGRALMCRTWPWYLGFEFLNNTWLGLFHVRALRIGDGRYLQVEIVRKHASDGYIELSITFKVVVESLIAGDSALAATSTRILTTMAGS